jgi:hypothetical protein
VVSNGEALIKDLDGQDTETDKGIAYHFESF